MKKNFVFNFLGGMILSLSLCLMVWAQTSGTLDSTFGNGGRSIISPPSSTLGGWEMDSVLQADGRIVSLLNTAIAGNGFRNSLVRLSANGYPDPSFGNGGFRDVVWSAPNGGVASTIALQFVQTANGPEERFVIAGNFSSGRNSSSLRVERYTNAGMLDTTFGNNGVTSFNLPLSGCKSAVQPDQKILIACDETLIRLNAGGTPDTSFGSGGVSPAKAISLADLIVLPNGRILGIGSIAQGKGRDLAIARFNPNGSLDDGGRNDSTPGDSFGAGGKVTLNIGNTDYGIAAAFDPVTGQIYVAGEAQIGGTTFQNFDAVITRFNYGGQLDTSFGSGGLTTFNIANLQDEFTSIALFNGKIIVAGEGRSGINDADYLVARYDLSGKLDPTFGNGGWLLHNFYGNYDHAGNVFIQSDPGCQGCPKLIVTGGVQTGLPSQSPSYLGVLRLFL